MALRNIVVDGDEILRKKCREVTEVNDRIKMTLADMLETMRDAMGVGIAAPQIGIMRRMFVAEPEPGQVYYMINPEILEQEGSQVDSEGCLSVPGYIGAVERPERIKIKALDLDGNEQVYDFEGFYARVMCHENDHLNGILFKDKATNLMEVTEDMLLDQDVVEE